MKALHLVFILNALGMCYGFGTRFGTSYRIQDVTVSFVDKEYLIIHDMYPIENHAIISNFTILKRFPENIRYHLIMWGSSMGQYVVPTPLDIEMGLCELMDAPIVLLDILSVGGFKEDDCPPSPGTYGCPDGYVLSTDRLPDIFPSDEYLIVTELTSSDHLLMKTETFLMVE